MQITYKLRLKDKHAKQLFRQARAVNVVWNYCNETQRHAARTGRRTLTGYELCSLTKGTSKSLELHAQSIQLVCQQYESKRRPIRKQWLRFRGKKSLGWVPFNTGTVSFDGKCFVLNGIRYEPMHYREIPRGKMSAGSFNQDSRGRWYINVTVEANHVSTPAQGQIGVDLGLKDLAVLSTGEKIPMRWLYRSNERALAVAQRANKFKRVSAIHAKIKNCRKDFLHKQSTKIAKEFGLVVVGDVSPSKLAKTRMAKSVLDAGWADFKKMLRYKSLMNGGTYLEVSEAYTSQTCSNCGSMPDSRPRGIAGLRIREWTCSDCGAVHDRDVNAAKNILRLGQQSLTEGAIAV